MKTKDARTPAPPRIVDATLREGMQAFGVRFGTRESVEIARALVDIGVDLVECGHPRVGEAESERVRAVAEACAPVPVLAHARARVDDVEAVKMAGASVAGIFVPVHEQARSSRLRPGCSVATMIRESVTHAKSIDLGVRFTVEDASRTPMAELVEAFGAALEAGADRICVADTVGLLCPWEVEDLIGALRAALSDPEIEVHLHDDRGMAAANALTAVRAGARWVSTSVNGIGERCGITDTITLIANLAALGLRLPPDGAALQRCSAIVQAHSRMFVDRWRPVVGRNAFTHVAKLHRTAMAKDERSYSWTSAASLGRAIELAPEPSERRPERLTGRSFERVRIGDRVEPRRHSADGVLLVLGNALDLTGLQVEVTLADRTFHVASPASVFIPSGVEHGYRVVGGSGLLVAHVLAGTCDSTLPD